AVACEKQDAEEPAGAEETGEQAAEEAQEPEQAGEADEQAEGDEPKADEATPVDVPEDGKKFDPPVEKAQIPDGAWFCDMGTVHYAQMKEGDGTCPECGMKLKQMAAGGEEEDPHAGHDHD
ncbi:MAG: hypothetical protein ACOC9J_03410, partial [Persicimonas sp.]